MYLRREGTWWRVGLMGMGAAGRGDLQYTRGSQGAWEWGKVAKNLEDYRRER